MEPTDHHSSALVIVIGVIALLALLALVLFVVRRVRYRRAVEAHGFSLERDPGPAPAYGLEESPFGQGTGRRVKLCISGHVTPTGAPPGVQREFRAFDYHTDQSSPPGLVMTVPLAHNFPPASLQPDGRFASPDAEFAGVVTQAMGATLGGLQQALPAELRGRLALGIDHQTLVLVGVPNDPETIASVAPALTASAASLDAPELGRFVGTPVPSEMGVSGHPGWIYRQHDDQALQRVRAERGGSNHQAHDVLLVPGPVAAVRLTHTWDTTHTETTTDSEGHTSTRTVTDHHREEVLEFTPPVPLPALKVNEGWWGNRRHFESIDFDERFKVRMADARLASDIFHPRMMQWLLETNPPPFQVRDDGVWTFDIDATDVRSILWGQQFVTAFLQRVPGFVYDNLRLPRPSGAQG